MKFVFAHFLILAYLNGANSKCTMDVYYIDWMFGSTEVPRDILDTERGDVYWYGTEDIIGIKNIVNGKYITAKLEGNNLTFYTTKDFENYDIENTRSNFDVGLTFECADGDLHEMDFEFTIKDVNNHRPIFNKEVYEYNLSMDLPPNVDLTDFGAINATDWDFTTEELYFAISPSDDFNVTRKNIEGYKINYAKLKPLRTIQAPYSKQFTLSVSDERNSNVTTVAQLTVTVSSNILSSLEFTQSVYYGNYLEDDTVEMEEPIKIKKGCDHTTIARLHNYTEYFEVSYNKITEELDIDNIKSLPKTIVMTGAVPLTIEAETPGVTYTRTSTVIIHTKKETNQCCSVEISGHSFDTIGVIVGVSVGGVLVIIILNVVFVTVWYRRNVGKLGLIK